MLERKSDRIEMITPTGAQESPLYDLSKTGVSCFHSVPKSKNNFVMVKVNNLLLKAKVVHCQKRKSNYRLGLQFWNVLPEVQEKLNVLVESYSRGVPVSCSIEEESGDGAKKKK